MNLKDAGVFRLTDIFKGTDSNYNQSQGILSNVPRQIYIPAYQRPYRWASENIRRLFSDYNDNNDEEYFLGSAVFVEKRVGNNSMLQFDVVDGQQRITTLFLLNYIRFLLKREYIILDRNVFNFRSLCTDLKNCYVNLIGRNNQRFDRISNMIDEVSKNLDIQDADRITKLIDRYVEEMCVPRSQNTPAETYDEIWTKASAFFKGETLCLKYSRQRYDTLLREALCSVYLQQIQATNNYSLATINDTASEDCFSKNYIVAMQTIFDEVWEKAKKLVEGDNVSPNPILIISKAISYCDQIICNMSLCVVSTENEKDAYKLFEVLNDRSLAVEDLELIKNIFYKEYCTRSNESDEDKDRNITSLEELWCDKIFSENNGTKRNGLISYLAAVYLTGDTELIYKDNTKLKNAIERYLGNLDGSELDYSGILAIFNVYHAIKIILDSFDIKHRNTAIASLIAEQKNDVSITYKAMNLLVAKEYYAVIPAITNVIISTYSKNNFIKSMSDTDFETNFTSFINNLKNDYSNTIADCKKIHQSSFILWNASLMSKDHNIPRRIAKRIIPKYKFKCCSADEIELLNGDSVDLNNELDEWLTHWTFDDKKKFDIKILLLTLFRSSKNSNDSINLRPSVVVSLNATSLDLDHLEAKTINNDIQEQYYLYNDPSERENRLNSCLGNYMILDSTTNNRKSNLPLVRAMSFYQNGNYQQSWLVKEILDMIGDNQYFTNINGHRVPTDIFFSERTKRLKGYFSKLLNRSFSDNII